MCPPCFLTTIFTASEQGGHTGPPLHPISQQYIQHDKMVLFGMYLKPHFALYL